VLNLQLLTLLETGWNNKIMGKRMKNIFMAFLLVMFVFAGASHATVIRCASTTSTQNSGLFEKLLPLFEKKTGITVQVIAVGTGAALKLGRNGDVDMVFVHARDKEIEMVKQGWFTGRKEVMYNDFVVVGPKTDPAMVRNVGSVGAAFKKIMARSSTFVSRGDNSGTHMKEMKIWQQTGQTPQSAKDRWYLAVGQGMAKTIRIAAEKGAYTLADRGTWYTVAEKEDLPLTIIFENDKMLENQYSVMMVNPERHVDVKKLGVQRFIDWLTTSPGQTAIDGFRSPTGKKLFIPNAK
jgi:tungstate transport system substrate-binding protein